MRPQVLLIEDNEGTRFGFVRYFSREGFGVVEAPDLATAGRHLAERQFDAMILDINLPDGNGIDFIDRVRESDPSVPIIIITASGDIPLAVEAMRRGADNFLVKPVDNSALLQFLRKTLEIGTLKRRLFARTREAGSPFFLGESSAMQEVLLLARSAAASDTPVLITGETGTGKGMLASWIHRTSRRSGNEFVELNCSGLRGEMLSRELFGHTRGAFTSADQDRKGLLDAADQGTLFLDEIGDMGVEIQAQFLKVLEEKTYRRLGDVRLCRSDFRLICATHRNLRLLLQENLFRQDLLYRINLLTIHIPPLRQRPEDLPGLVRHLLTCLGAAETELSGESMAMLMAYDWPGNVRELRNVLERALLLAPRGDQLCPCHFPVLESQSAGTPPQTVQQVEHNHIRAVLEQMGGDVEKAARSLNISRATLYRRLKQMHLVVEDR